MADISLLRGNSDDFPSFERVDGQLLFGVDDDGRLSEIAMDYVENNQTKRASLKPLDSDNIDYDNTSSGLASGTVQDAVDELAGREEELTYSEYQQLSTAEKNSGKTFFITDLENTSLVHTYTSGERPIGKWIDNKPLYQKTINFGALPNATSKSVAHGVSNFKRGILIVGYAYNSTSGDSIPIGSSNAKATSSGVTITTGSDMSAFTECYVTIQYTKTSDDV